MNSEFYSLATNMTQHWRNNYKVSRENFTICKVYSEIIFLNAPFCRGKKALKTRYQHVLEKKYTYTYILQSGKAQE